MKWWKISILLCSYGFFKEFRPSEPFISPFLTQFKNFTVKEVNEEMYPVGTYAYLSLLIAVFLLTDFLRYKPVLIAGSVSAVITWSLLVWGTTIDHMKVVEIFYGFFMASEVAYFTYIYAKVDKEHYQKVTSHTRAAFLLGKAGAGLSSQILVYCNINYLELNYFTIFGVAITIPIACILPPVRQSLYFHQKKSEKALTSEEVNGPESEEISRKTEKSGKGGCCKEDSFYKEAFVRLYDDFKEAFTNSYVLKWSMWWALATCGYLQVASYSQLLWQSIVSNEETELYHGYVEFVSAVLGAVTSFAVGYIKVPWNKWGDITLGIITLLQGGFLIYSSYLDNLFIAYAMYMAYKLLYDTAVTVATCEIAKFINEDSYALVFGFNTFITLVVQTILTAIVIDILKIDIRPQFQIYGGYHLFIGCGFLLFGLCVIIFCRRRFLTN